MTAGLQVYNDSGIIQIDQDYKNFGLISSGTITLSTTLGSTWNNAYYATVVATGRTNPVLAFRANSDEKVCIAKTDISGSTWTFYIVGTGGEDVDWYLFDILPSSGLDTYGLQVNNSSGQPVFHSSVPCIRVVGQITYPAASLTVSSGRDYAIVQSASRINKLSTIIGGSSRRDTYITMPYFNTSNTSLTAGGVLINQQTVTLETEYNNTGPAIRLTCIDVTNL